MNKNFKYLQKIFFLLVMGFSLCVVQACSSDDENEDDSSKVLENRNVMVNGHEAVDLGLSVKWATCNIGSYTPEGYGKYYAWGETKTKSDYSWKTHKWCKGTYDTMTKYCTDEEYGTVDNRTVLDSSDDVATVNWGRKWRMPTEEEFDELIDECTWTWTRLNNVNGYVVTGPSGKQIFLPAAGGHYGGSGGHYWSATLCEYRNSCSYSLEFYSQSIYFDGRSRDYGFTVRPVTE